MVESFSGLFNVRPMDSADWPIVSDIYRQGLQTGLATFEEVVPHWQDWDRNHLKTCRIVGEMEGNLVGWAALTPVSARKIYAGVAEVSVYVGLPFWRKGAGEALLQELILQSEHQGIWTLQSGIFSDNLGSIALHEKLGFRKVGFREKIGQSKGAWRDTILMERRSRVVNF